MSYKGVVYVFGIKELGAMGLMEEVYLLPLKEFEVIASLVGPSSFDPDARGDALSDAKTRNQLVTHVMVLTSIAAKYAVLPARFGTTFHTLDEMRAALIPRADQLKKQLESFRGKGQWVIRVYADVDSFGEQGRRDLLGHSVTSSVLGVSKALVEIRDSLIACSVDSRMGHLFAQGPHSDVLPLLFNASFLVEQAKVDLFITIAESFKRQEEKQGIFVTVTGPWPPFSFVADWFG